MKRIMAILGTFFRMKAEEAWEFALETAAPIVATVLLVALVLGGSSYMIGWGLLGWDGYVKTMYCPDDGSKTVEQVRENLVKEGVFKARVTAGVCVIIMLVFALAIVFCIVYAAYKTVTFLIGNWRDAVSEVDSRRQGRW